MGLVVMGKTVVPGMRVTVYLPPNLVGLKISDCRVAIAAHIH